MTRPAAWEFPATRSSINGPYKPPPGLERAVTEGAMIQVDHLDEICDLEALSDKLGRKIRIGLRLNLDAGIYPQWSRFGFNLESGQALDAVKRILNGGKLILHGLHCHIGTFILEPKAYARQIEKMVAFAYEIEEQSGFGIEYLDIGGGLPSRNRLKATYLPPDVAIPASASLPSTSATPCIAPCGPASSPSCSLNPAGQ